MALFGAAGIGLARPPPTIRGQVGGSASAGLSRLLASAASRCSCFVCLLIELLEANPVPGPSSSSAAPQSPCHQRLDADEAAPLPAEIAVAWRLPVG